MLQFDMAGKLIEPARLKKTYGGKFDKLNGIPDNFEIPTTGDYSGVTVSDYAGDVHYAKTLTRASAGKAAVTASTYWLVKGDVEAFKLSAGIIGGGSSATSGNTKRSFRIGLVQNTGNYGAFLEYRNPDHPDGQSTQFIVIDNGVETPYPVNYRINNPGERYPVELWLTRNRNRGTWVLTLAQGGQISTFKDIGAVNFNEKYMRPLVEWDWTASNGTFNPSIAYMYFDVYWRF
tara:strand:- start:648 stop:1346 length:699 start_codon:yes stop_codon:yes gene_type:complete